MEDDICFTQLSTQVNENIEQVCSRVESIHFLEEVRIWGSQPDQDLYDCVQHIEAVQVRFLGLVKLVKKKISAL